MAAVEFYQYYCKCGKFLFNNCDILELTATTTRNYIFVDIKDVPVYYLYNNSAKCMNCHISVGGFCHLIDKQRDTIRFCQHLIIRKIKRLYVYRVVDEGGNIIEGLYETLLL